MISLESVQNERFVCLRDLSFRESSLVRQVHLSGDRPGNQTRRFGVHLQVDRLRRLDTDNKFVTTDILKDNLRYILVLNTDLYLGLVKG